MWDKAFAKAIGERVVRVAAASALGLLGGSVLVQDVDWPLVVSSVAMAVLLDLLASVAGMSGVVAGVGPSLTKAEQVIPESAAGMPATLMAQAHSEEAAGDHEWDADEDL